MEFKDNLFRFRKEKGFSQEELAALCHVSRQAVSKWENGSSKPDSENLILLAKYLEVSTDSLLGIEDYKEKEYAPYMNPYRVIEYTSKWKICGIPIIDVYLRASTWPHHYGYRANMPVSKSRCAKGIIAIGNRAIGFLTLSLVGFGVIGIGLFNIGLLFSFGIFSIGFYSLGIVALGYLAIGVLAFGMYTFGVLSCAFHIAVGVVTFSKDIAVGITGNAREFIQLSEGRTCVVDTKSFVQLQSILKGMKLPGFLRAVLETLRLC